MTAGLLLPLVAIAALGASACSNADGGCVVLPVDMRVQSSVVATPQPLLIVTPRGPSTAPVSFGEIAHGTCVERQFRVDNAGGGALHLDALVTDVDGHAFAIAGASTADLKAGAPALLRVRFVPGEPGSYRAQFVLTDAAQSVSEAQQLVGVAK